MRGLLVALATTVVVLGSGAPALTVTADPQTVVPGAVLVPRPDPAPDLLPDPDEGCTVPVTGSMPPCPGPGLRRPRVACVLPVGADRPGVVVPDCGPHDPSPERRVVPALPPLSR